MTEEDFIILYEYINASPLPSYAPQLENVSDLPFGEPFLLHILNISGSNLSLDSG
jgi:hypothetical protein